jgi:anti-sigma B factor antagonist
VKCDISEQQGFLVVALGGDVDLASSPEARRAILDSLDQGSVLVDLSAVAYIDSSGVASLVEGYQVSKDKGVRFGLVGVSENARMVLQLSHLDRVFPIHATVQDAVAHGS